MLKAIVVTGLALMLAGCSGVSYVVQEYSGIEVINWRDEDGTTFRIFDKPQDSKLMITPSLGASAAQGLTFGASREPGLVYEAAANEWLAAQGRGNCRVFRTVNILDPQHEAYYRCS